MVGSKRVAVLFAVTGVALAACSAGPAAAPPTVPAPVVVTAPPADVPVSAGAVMGASKVTAEQLTAWFESKRITGARPTVPVDQLAAIFIAEGQREGVTGDVAFVQSMIETGWLRFPDSGQVRASDNNFAGLGAVDGGSHPATFADATTGVRAQIQHLRAYADPTVSAATLHAPLVDPRFALVSPKGKAPNWSQFGSGIWASSPTYGSQITALYAELIRFSCL